MAVVFGVERAHGQVRIQASHVPYLAGVELLLHFQEDGVESRPDRCASAFQLSRFRPNELTLHQKHLLLLRQGNESSPLRCVERRRLASARA